MLVPFGEGAIVSVQPATSSPHHLSMSLPLTAPSTFNPSFPLFHHHISSHLPLPPSLSQSVLFIHALLIQLSPVWFCHSPPPTSSPIHFYPVKLSFQSLHSPIPTAPLNHPLYRTLHLFPSTTPFHLNPSPPSTLPSLPLLPSPFPVLCMTSLPSLAICLAPTCAFRLQEPPRF